MYQKWSDYCITGVRENQAGDLIAVERRKDTGDSLGNPEIVGKATVVAEIFRGVTYITAIRLPSTFWERGADVHVVTVHTIRGLSHYLRTDRNNTPRDNLGSLPKV